MNLKRCSYAIQISTERLQIQKPAIPCKNRVKARLIGVSRPEPGSGHRLRCATGMPVDVIETQYREDQGHPTWYNYDQRHYSSHSAMPLGGSKSPHSPKTAHGSSRARRHPMQGHRHQSDRQPLSHDSPWREHRKRANSQIDSCSPHKFLGILITVIRRQN